ncbi:MAG: cupin domain-containing protein [Thermodesulfobacteriota bacterium]|nr:cupin domain-containing protein [Thermodesulfobacteriota bacterium]
MNRVKIFALNDQFNPGDRGWAFFPFQAGLGLSPAGCDLVSLHMVKTRPGARRGNHRHPESAEWLYVYGGNASFYWQEEAKVKEALLNKGAHAVYIPADTAHAIKNTGTGPFYLTAFREVSSQCPHAVEAVIV